MGLQKPTGRAGDAWTRDLDTSPEALKPHDETDPGLPATPMETGQDGHKRYLLPDPSGERDGLVPFTRASTLKGRTQDKQRLHDYDVRMVQKGLAISPDLVALAAATPLGARGSNDVLKEVAEQARTRAGARASANLGSALHTFTERVDRGEKLEDVLADCPAALRPDVEAYARLLETEGLTPVPELVERIVVNQKLTTGYTWEGKVPEKYRADTAAGVAARFDRMYLWTDPTDGVEYLVSGDLKTGKNAVEYGSKETAVQLAIAVHADLLWDEDAERYEDMPPRAPEVTGATGTVRPTLRTDIGLLIHLPVGQGHAHAEELDLVYGWDVAQLGVKLMLADKAEKHIHRPFRLRRQDGGLPPAPEPMVEIGQTEGPVTLKGDAPKTDPNLRTYQGQQDGGLAKDGSPLQPLAGDGERGCSACRRKGHRKGSPKCWGERDVAILASQDVTTMLEEDEARVLAASREYIEQAFAKLPDPDAAPADTFTPEAESVPHEKPVGPPCPHAGGFTRLVGPKNEAGEITEPDRWVCAKCGEETPQAKQGRLAREAMEHPIKGRTADLDAALASPPEPAPEPEQPAETPAEALMRMIKELTGDTPDQLRAKLQVLRKTGLDEGIWTPEHTKAGLEKLRSA